jgi:hypothetical protein
MSTSINNIALAQAILVGIDRRVRGANLCDKLSGVIQSTSKLHVENIKTIVGEVCTGAETEEAGARCMAPSLQRLTELDEDIGVFVEPEKRGTKVRSLVSRIIDTLRSKASARGKGLELLKKLVPRDEEPVHLSTADGPLTPIARVVFNPTASPGQCSGISPPPKVPTLCPNSPRVCLGNRRGVHPNPSAASCGIWPTSAWATSV